jgi:WD40 repeat protein
VYIWQAHPNEIIWDLKHHNHENLILTASADGIVSLWKTPTLSEIPRLLDDENENSKLEDKLFVRSFHLSDEMNEDEVPTSLDWSKVNPNQFIVSYTTGEIGVFDYNQESPLFKFAYGEPSVGDLQSKQVNMVKTHPTLNLAITVSENGIISVFDIDESGK